MTKWMMILTALLSLSGCANVNVSEYAERQPRFAIEDYFLGETRAWGIFQDRSGEVKRQFTVDMVGELTGDTLVLTEDFVYDDGEESQRIWTIKKINEHLYHGTADDVVGTAIGEAYGNALNWKYTLKLPVGDSVYEVKFDDWMYLQEDGVLLNKAKMSKFGFHLGDVTLAFKKPE